MYAYVVQIVDAARSYSQAMSSLRKQLRSSPQQTAMPALPAMPAVGAPPAAVNSGIFNRIAILVARIKQHAAYTSTMGSDMGIIAPANNINIATMAPDLSIRLESGFPLLRWKKGDSDGVNIYVDRHDNAGFVFLRRTVRTSYLDSEPLAPNTFTATWDYKVRYLIEDDEVGLFSSTISINILRGS